MSLDAYGRLRASNPFSLFNYYPTPLTSSSNLDEDVWIQTLSVSNSSMSYNTANFISLTLTGNSSYALMQSKQPMDYLSGKGRLYMMTGVLLSRAIAGGESFTSRIGAFNVDSSTPPAITSGVYFQTDGTNLQWVNVTQNNSGTVVTTVVNQSSWNIDTFDGTGPSGLTLTISSALTTFLIFIEQEWLGVGGTKVGFFINNVMYYANFFSNSGLSVQYTNTPRQRISYYIVGTTVSSSLSNKMMCSTYISEGGYFPLGKRNSVITPSAGISVAVAGRYYVMLAVRVNSLYPNATLKTLNISVSFNGASSSNTCSYQLQLFSTYGNIGALNAALTFTSLTDSVAQYATGDGSTQYLTTGGYVLTSGSVNSQATINFTRSDYETLLTRTICTRYNNTFFDTLILFGTSTTNTALIFGGMDFVEML
jgi:hypothetical protein